MTSTVEAEVKKIIVNVHTSETYFILKAKSYQEVFKLFFVKGDLSMVKEGDTIKFEIHSFLPSEKTTQKNKNLEIVPKCKTLVNYSGKIVDIQDKYIVVDAGLPVCVVKESEFEIGDHVSGPKTHEMQGYLLEIIK